MTPPEQYETLTVPARALRDGDVYRRIPAFAGQWAYLVVTSPEVKGSRVEFTYQDCEGGWLGASLLAWEPVEVWRVVGVDRWLVADASSL